MRGDCSGDVKIYGKLEEASFGHVNPDETVDLYFNLSSKQGQKDRRGLWNREPAFSPQGGAPTQVVNPDDEHKTLKTA